MKRLKKGFGLKKTTTLTVLFLSALCIAGAQDAIINDLTEADEASGVSGRTGQRAINAAETAADRHRREITEEVSAQLFNMDIWDTNVSLFLGGYWKGSIHVNWGLANSPLGTVPETNDSPLLFTQEADLTLSLWIWQKWFLEVSFIDNYNLNTYRAGYQGFLGETIQYAGVGNTGLDFPVFPYLDLGGDSPSSFGVYGRFGSENLTFHVLVRYDAAAREERIFVGNRERSFSTMVPDKPLRGRSFVLPDENINSIPVVYFEDKDGPLLGGGRRWRIANPSEFAVSAYYGLVELVREPRGMVAVSYNGGYSSLGIYNSLLTPPYNNGTDFLGNVQNHFGENIDLKAYPQPGGGIPLTPSGLPGIFTFDNNSSISALVIYEPGTFSPFERQSRYMSPSNTTEDAALISLGTGERRSGYEVLPANTLSLDIGMYTLTGDNTSRNIFEIVSKNGGGLIRRLPESCWPLAGEYPDLYLPGSPVFNEDLRLRFTSYGAAGAFNIGNDVIPGSVQVYRAGIIDSQVNFDAGSGIVTLTSPVGFSEVIRITYLKRSEERRLGSLAAGVGLIYKPDGGHFNVETALGMRWNISREAYTEEGAASPGTVGLSARTSWDYNRLQASLSLGIGYVQPDTTGLYRIAGMEGNSEIVLGMSTSAGFISERPAGTSDFPKRLVYRNYKKSDWLGGSEIQSIEWPAPEISGLQGPYPSRVGNIDVYVAEFTGLDSGEWTGFQAPLGRDGELLEQAKSIAIPFRFYEDGIPGEDIEVIVQFGTLAEEGSGTGENPNLLVEKIIHTGVPSSALLVEELILTDEYRRKLRSANQMRIIIKSSGTPVDNRILIAKPFIYGASWRAITADTGEIKAAQDDGIGTSSVLAVEKRGQIPESNKTNRLNENIVNHVLEIRWEDMESAGTDGRTSAIPLSDYRVLSFYLKLDPNDFDPGSIFHFLVARGPGAYNKQIDLDKSALRVDIKLGDFLQDINPDSSGWYNVEIRYRDGYVLINNQKCTAVEFKYNSGNLRHSFDNGDFTGEGQSGYIAVFLTEMDNSTSNSGVFSIDEICLEDPAPSYRINGGATLNWQHPEALTIGGKTIISGVAFNTALESAAMGNPFESGGETFTGLQSRSRGELTVLGTRVSGNLNFTVSNDNSYWNAGHGISRSFGPLSIAETFNTAPYPDDETMNHLLSIRLNTLLYGNIASSINYQNNRLARHWSASTGLKSERNGRPGFSLEGNLNYLERPEKVWDWIPNYAGTWIQSWAFLFPDDGSGTAGSTMQGRDMRGRASFNLDRLPVGVELSFEGNSSVSIPFEFTRTGSIARIESPFTFGSIRGRLRLQRDISQNLHFAGGSIGDDISQYGYSFSNTSALWSEIPVYALFNSRLDSAIKKTQLHFSIRPENIRFRESLSLNLVFPERYNWFSLFVPVTHYTQLDRNMEQRMDTLLDVFTISSGFGFSSINLFGAMGTNPVFSFYRNDEIRHSISGIISFPRYEDPLWRIQAEQNIRFFGFNGAELGVQNTFTIIGADRNGWSDSFSLLWIVPREKTLLSSLYSSGMEKLSGKENFPALSELALTEYERFFRESMELVIDNSDEYGIYSFMLGHESVVRIVGRLTLTGFAKLGIQRNNRFDTLSILLSFGTTLSVIF